MFNKVIIVGHLTRDRVVIQNIAKRQRIAKHWLIFTLKIFEKEN